MCVKKTDEKTATARKKVNSALSQSFFLLGIHPGLPNKTIQKTL